MSTAEINKVKEELIHWISDLNDVSVLNFLTSIRMSKHSDKKDWWDSLSSEEIANIEEGLQDIKEGNVISSKDFWSRLNDE